MKQQTVTDKLIIEGGASPAPPPPLPTSLMQALTLPSPFYLLTCYALNDTFVLRVIPTNKVSTYFFPYSLYSTWTVVVHMNLKRSTLA